jgi:hypothetical protein
MPRINLDEALRSIENIAVKYGYSRYDSRSCHLGFKKVRNHHIVILEITGENNEDRISKYYEAKKHAKMRCSQAIVKTIIDLSTCREVDYSVKSICDPSFIYTINATITPKLKYDNEFSVCSSGIHYFLSPETALMFDLSVSDVIGNYKTWDNDGNLTYASSWKYPYNHYIRDHDRNW